MAIDIIKVQRNCSNEQMAGEPHAATHHREQQRLLFTRAAKFLRHRGLMLPDRVRGKQLFGACQQGVASADEDAKPLSIRR